jgi:hypothetical protein
MNRIIAQVGYTKTPGDVVRITQAITWCDSHGYNFGEYQWDYIDLRKGRDFLAETNEYEIVILHFLFRGGFLQKPGRNKKAELSFSPLTSWVIWRKRLVATKAKLIFVFGGPTEIGGSYLVNLDGYKSHKVAEEFWVFERTT